MSPSHTLHATRGSRGRSMSWHLAFSQTSYQGAMTLFVQVRACFCAAIFEALTTKSRNVLGIANFRAPWRRPPAPGEVPSRSFLKLVAPHCMSRIFDAFVLVGASQNFFWRTFYLVTPGGKQFSPRRGPGAHCIRAGRDAARRNSKSIRLILDQRS